MLQKVLFAIYILAVLTISATADANQTETDSSSGLECGLCWISK
jgi:hypothetical protein